ncbi:MAG: hypothetical protein IKJ35_00765 [Clostridia bacterium]|nr:hypothetical protein [Clostridia bacterium]
MQRNPIFLQKRRLREWSAKNAENARKYMNLFWENTKILLTNPKENGIIYYKYRYPYAHFAFRKARWGAKQSFYRGKAESQEKRGFSYEGF